MRDRQVDVLVVGGHAPGVSVRVRRLPVPGETVIGWDLQEPLDGGKGSNQAVAAARLGATVSFVGCVGNDRQGDMAESFLREAGVGCAGLRRSPTSPTAGGVILLDGSGVPAMVTTMGANADLELGHVLHVLEQDGPPRVLLTQLEVPVPVVLQSLRHARRLGARTVLNVAPVPATFAADRCLGDIVDVLVPNEVEATTLLGLAATANLPAEELANRLRAATGVDCVLVTLGERGFVGADGDGTWSQRPPPVEVVDTSGAGDEFCAALAVQLSRGDAVRPASRRAGLAATLSVTTAGTVPSFPTGDEVVRFGQGVLPS